MVWVVRATLHRVRQGNGLRVAATRRGAVVLGIVLGAVCLTGCGTPPGAGGQATTIGATPSAEATGWFSYTPPPHSAPPGAHRPTPNTKGAAMTTDEFWQVVDRAAAADPDAAAGALEVELSRMDAATVAAFGAEYYRQMLRSDTWLHLAAAETVMGFTSDDVFRDFRTWTLFQGRAVYDAFVADPDSLAGRGPQDDEQVGMAEDLEYLPVQTWEQLTGKDPFESGSGWPEDPEPFAEPSGSRLTEQQRAQRLPRLSAAYVGGSADGGVVPITPR